MHIFRRNFSTQFAPVKCLLGPHVTKLPSSYFMLYPVQGRLVPLRLAIEDFNLTSSDQHSLPDLSGQAVPGVGSDLGPVVSFLPLMCTLLVLHNE